MGKNSGGVRREPRGDYKFKGKIEGVESIKNIKHADVYREVKSAISRYHAVLGVRQKEVKLADLPANVSGAHVTSEGKSQSVYLNKDLFNSRKSTIIDEKRLGYKTGWSTKTNKPIAHTVTHELAHATWNSALKSPNARKAGKEISAVYKMWAKDKKKKGYGQYAKTSVNEFFSETITKGIHGKSDKYTRALFEIVKKHKL